MSLSVALVAGPDPGHAFNVLGLGEVLAARGHDVTIGTGTQHRAATESAGLRFVELPLLAPTDRDHDMGQLIWGRGAEMATPLAELLRPLAPDVVVSDVLTRAGAFAAELLGVPWVELSPHHLFEPDPAIPPVGLGRAPATTWWRRRSDDRIRRAQQASLDHGAELEAEVRRRIGLPPDGPGAEARLLCTLPALELRRQDWPRDAHVVGPMGWEPAWDRLAPPDGTAPLVVVTDSTASTVRRSLAETALDGLRYADVRLVVTTGRDDLDADRAGVRIGRAPHGPLLDEAALAVGPGGGGFVAKALVRGVPLVLVPLMGDQRETAGRVRHRGLGRSLKPRWTTPTTLRLTVEHVLADRTYADRARGVADDARARGLGPDLAAGLVEAAAARDVPPSTGPHGPPG
ncbi:MAG: glycosyl transferase [Actinobacteria bacterium]|nr:glycosyl transferase [Actinomycetota bacterium]